MKLRPHVLAAVIAMAAPAIVQADTVFYSGGNGISSVTGTIVKQNSDVVEVLTSDGKTVTIDGNDVFQIIRENQFFEGGDLDPGTSKSQSHSTRNDHFGLKGGMNISNMSADPQNLEEEDSLKSFAFGAWYGLPLNRRVTFQPEAYYSVKGDAESVNGFTTSTKVSYLDLPVLAKIGFLHSASVQPSLFVGPSVAFNLSAKSKFEGDGSDIEVDVKDQMNTLDVGVVVGGGVDIPVAGRNFGLELRYSKGLTNAVGDEANGDAHNDVIAVMGSIGLQ